ncbi:MAG: autotransporter-associated beta strand repeat-containing protein [Planctomycetia bacterium]|nr:autotransporter-associated beta strand repeat-containing protein [Planctomycetia bacterium]
MNNKYLWAGLFWGMTLPCWAEVVYNPDTRTYSGTGTWTDAITMNADTTFVPDSTGTISVTGALSGSGKLLKTGTGTLSIVNTGNKSFSIDIQGGLLQYASTRDYNLTGNLTGSGTLHFVRTSSGGYGKTVAGGDWSNFTGTIINETGRWIELRNNGTDLHYIGGGQAVWDIRTMTTGNNRNEGIAIAPHGSSADTTTVSFGAITGSADVVRSGGSDSSYTKLHIVVGNAAITQDYTFSGDIRMNTQSTEGNAMVSVEKIGPNTWTLLGNKNYSGKTTVTAGTLQLGNGTTAGSVGSTAYEVAENATLRLNSPAATTRTAAFTGTGTIENAGTFRETLVLTNQPTLTYQGENTINTAYYFPNSVSIPNRGTVRLQAGDSPNGIFFAGKLTGNGTLENSGKKLVLAGDFSEFTGTFSTATNNWLELWDTSAVADISGSFTPLCANSNGAPNAVFQLNHRYAMALQSWSDTPVTFSLGAISGLGDVRYTTRNKSDVILKIGRDVETDNYVHTGYFYATTQADTDKLSLVKTGKSTWTLAGDHTLMKTDEYGYTGKTTVEDGKLILSGKILGDLDVLAPGGETSPALELTGSVGGDLRVAGNLSVSRDGVGNVLTGTVLGDMFLESTASLILDFGENYVPTSDEWYLLYDVAGEVDTTAFPSLDALFANPTDAYYWNLAVEGGNFILSADSSAVPEPGSGALLLLASLYLVLKYRKKSFKEMELW